MVQITKPVQPKHKETLSPYIDKFVSVASTLPSQQLPDQLAQFPSRWPFPRGDLYHWIPLLNRFDDILGKFCSIYKLQEGPQVRSFTCELLDQDKPADKTHVEAGFAQDGDRQLVEAILGFSKLLLENCGNRSIYASSPYLSDLFNSTSLSLLVAVLAIGTQLAMRFQASYKRMAHNSQNRPAYSALLANHYNINLNRVQTLSAPPSRTVSVSSTAIAATPITPGTRGKEKSYFDTPSVGSNTSVSTYFANDLVQLAKGKRDGATQATSTAPWEEWAEVRLTYYETVPAGAPSTSGQGSASAESDGRNAEGYPATPTPIRYSSSAADPVSATPTPGTTSIQTSSPGRTGDSAQSVSTLQILHISAAEVKTSTIHQLLVHYLPKIPKTVHYELLHKLRLAYAFVSSIDERRQILLVRILAVTNLSYIHTEQIFREKVLKQDSEEPRRLQLVYQLAELLHSPAEGETAVPRFVQTLAMQTLEALGQFESTSEDITHALNTNLNHGTLLSVLRKAVSEMAETSLDDIDSASLQRTEDDMWRSSIFGLLTLVSDLPRAGPGLLAAGLFPLLVDALKLRNSVAERNFNKIFVFFDHVMLSVKDAFQALVSADGLDAISDLVIYEIQAAAVADGMDRDYRHAGIDHEIPFFRHCTIRGALKSIHRMMSNIGGSGGNNDRLLRNLIDSSKFLSSLRQVYENGRKFGANLWTNAVTILNDFINNEPTSYSIIAEAGLSKAFLESIIGEEIKSSPPTADIDVDATSDDGQDDDSDDDDDMFYPIDDTEPHPPTQETLSKPREHKLARGIMASSEAINVIPQTFSAICLNSAGMRMFQESGALNKFFEIFESAEHVQVMVADPSLTVALGHAFEELIRHHTPLKDAVINATIDMVARVAYLCNSPTMQESWSAKLYMKGHASTANETVEESARNNMNNVTGSMDEEMAEAPSAALDGTAARGPADRITSKVSTSDYVDNVAQYLSSILHNNAVRSGFVDKGGIELVLDLVEAASLPLRATQENYKDDIIITLATLADQKPHLVMPSLLKRTQRAIDRLAPFATHSGQASYFQRYVASSPSSDSIAVEDIAEMQTVVKALNNVQSLSTALRYSVSPPTPFHLNNRGNFAAYNNVNLTDYWIDLVHSMGPVLKAAILEDIKLQTAVSSKVARSLNPNNRYMSSNAKSYSIDIHDTAISGGGSAGIPLVITEEERNTDEVKNYYVVKFLVSRVAATFTPLFQTLGKSLLSKRSSIDAYHRRLAGSIADTLATTIHSLLQLDLSDPQVEELEVRTVPVVYTLTISMEVVKQILIVSGKHNDQSPHINTLVLEAFKKQDGLSTLNTVLKHFRKLLRIHIGDKSLDDKDTTKRPLLHTLASTGIGNVLSIYHMLCNGKVMAEAPQALAMVNKSSGFRDSTLQQFNIHQLIVETRLSVLSAARDLWESDVVEQGNSTITSKLIDVIRTIATADCETNARKRSDNVPPMVSPIITKPWKPMTIEEAPFIYSEFDEVLAREALFRCYNNVQVSTEYCAAHRDQDRAGGRCPIPEFELDLIARDQAEEHNTLTVASDSTDGHNVANQHFDDAMVDVAENGDVAHPQRPDTGHEEVTLSADSTTETTLNTVATVDDLNEERQAIRKTLVSRCLDVINSQASLTFQVSDLITTVVNKSPDPNTFRKDVGETLVVTLTSFAMTEPMKPIGKEIAAHAHLIALMLQDRPFYLASVDELTSNFEILLGFIKLDPQGQQSVDEPNPWIAHVLLIIETLLCDDAQARETKWSYPNTESDIVEPPVVVVGKPIVSPQHSQLLLNAIMDMLPRVGKDESLALAILRILVILTRDRSIAMCMSSMHNMQRLFVMAKQLAGPSHGRLLPSMLLILRHIVEDEETIKQIMRTEIQNFFEHKPRSSQPSANVSQYLSHCAGMICRAPEIFVESTHDMVKLAKWSAHTADAPLKQAVLLKDEYASAKSDPVLPAVQATEELSIEDIKPSTEATQPAISHPGSAASVVSDKSDGVIHFLISELWKYKGIEDHDLSANSSGKKPDEQSTDQTLTSTPISSTSSGSAQFAAFPQLAASATQPSDRFDADNESKDAKKHGKHEFKAEAHPIYVYRCFLLECLTELLQSYNRTKMEFISFKPGTSGQIMTPSKPRSSVLNYLLVDLVSQLSLENADTVAGRKRHTTAVWAGSLITALLSNTGEKVADKRNTMLMEHDDDPDLFHVRKFVLDNVLRAYKDATYSTEALDSKYARILSLANLMSDAISGRDVQEAHMDNVTSRRPSYQIKRIMYEKGFLTALTASIAEIDVNYPLARRAIKYILRPIKALTQAAIELSESGKITTPTTVGDEDEVASAMSVSDIESDREMTPDLFRNSALGMTEPGRDHDSSDSEDHDEEMYEGEFDDEGMEYEEEIMENDEDDNISDEDEELGEMGHIEGLSGDHPIGLDIMDDDDDDEDDDDEDSEGDDSDDIDDDMDDMDDEGHIHEDIEIVDEEGNVLHGAEDDEGWDTDGDEGDDDEDQDEEDFDTIAAEQEEALLHGYTGPANGAEMFGSFLDSIGDIDGDDIFQRLDEAAEEHEDEEHMAGFGHDDDADDVGEADSIDEDDDDEGDDDEEEMEIEMDEEDLEDPYHLASHHAANHAYSWGDPLDQPMIISHRGPAHRTRYADGPNPFMVPAGSYSTSSLRAPRPHRHPSAPHPIEEGINPLLQRNNESRGNYEQSSYDPTSASFAVVRPDGRHIAGEIISGGNQPTLMSTIPGGGQPTLMSILRNVQSLHPDGPLSFQVAMSPHQGHVQQQLQALISSMSSAAYPPHANRRRDDPPYGGATNTFVPKRTTARWQEEAKIMFGPNFEEKARRVLTAIMSILVPAGIQASIEAKRLEQEAAKKRDEANKAMLEKKAAEEAAAREKKMAEEAEERIRQEQIAAEAAQAAEAATNTSAQETNISDVINNTESMEGIESVGSASATTDAPVPPPQRVIVHIQDREVDITDLGIDAEFLQQIPEELREEVIASAIQDRRSQTVAAGAQPSGIEQEFLDALPAEIREEIIQQERLDRRRRERDEARRNALANGGPAALPQDMDPASILATLDPTLREQVLMEQNDEILGLLPPSWTVRAQGRRNNETRSSNDPVHAGTGGSEPVAPKPVRRTIVQMLDKSGVATLLRLMFVSQQGNLKTTLCHVLQNVSENRHNRGEVISTLLHILQDGSADMSAVERSFAQLSLRAKHPKDKDSIPKTPQAIKRSAVNGGINNVFTSSDISPLLVVQQCLTTLVYLSGVNVHVPSFFLTEHEQSMKRSNSRKGKGKETRANKFAINSLLSLLDRPLIMESASIMESLSDLLSRITYPLQSLDRKQKQEAEAQKLKAASSENNAPASSEEATAATQQESVVASTTATNTTNTNESMPQNKDESAETNAATAKKAPPFTPPVIPEANLKLVINIFVARECGNKTFRDTLSTIKNLSCIPGAKDIFGHELIKKAQGLAETIFVDLEELLPQIENAQSGAELQSVALNNFSPAGSDQNKLLKVLKALDHIFDVKTSKVSGDEVDTSADTASAKQDLLLSLYENKKFIQMWDKLSACLSAIQRRERMLNIATILLPLIESLMVVCKNTTLKDTTNSAGGAQTLVGSPPPDLRIGNLFFSFTEEHRKILNDLVRTTPKLMTGSFSLLVKNPKVLEFDNKRNYFSRSMHDKDRTSRQSHAPLQFTVKRDQVFHDSYRSLGFKKGDELKYGKLSIRFSGEEGVDAGGVTREWFQVLTRQMFDPGYALFVPVSSDRTTFHPNHLSGINPEHLSFFKFIGRIIGKALYENRVLDCHFSRAVYKSILGKSVSIKDLESLDPEYYKSVVWMMDNDITDIITETFSVDDDEFGVVTTVDLIENGRNVPVTQENKNEYIKLMVEHKLVGSVKEQLGEFLKGFHEIIPAEVISIFNEQELELLISGLPEIDVDDWKANTELHQYSASSPQIQWFWRAMRSFDKEERAKMLQFVTGTSKVPLNGFKELEGMNGYSKFNIHRDYGNKDRLPTSHTCFNQLDLPEYDNYETLRQQILTAITAGSEYFGFA